MVIVYVKHYLVKKGIHYFQTQWFQRVHSILKEQLGFISITYDMNENVEDCVDIFLKFENQSTLDDWIAVPEHDELIKALDTYRSRDYWLAAKTVNEQADLSKLEWTVIKPTSDRKKAL